MLQYFKNACEIHILIREINTILEEGFTVRIEREKWIREIVSLKRSEDKQRKINQLLRSIEYKIMQYLENLIKLENKLQAFKEKIIKRRSRQWF